jgi:putative intracellular protease/amidase
MKKLLLLFLSCLMLLSCSKSHKVLIFVRDGSTNLKFMLENEVGRMKDLLTQEGYEVNLATITGEQIVNDSISLKPDMKLTSADVEDYVGLMIPCMAAGATINPEAVDFVKKAVNRRMPVAAQTNAILILAKAGALNGRKYAFYNEDIRKSAQYPEFQKAIYSGNGVVRDGNIITAAYCPQMALNSQGKFKDCTTELTREFIEAVKHKH